MGRSQLEKSPTLEGTPKSSTSKHQSKVDKLLRRLPGLGEEYRVEEKVGEGTFSSVYLGRSLQDDNCRVAIKHLIPTCHPTRIATELKCMHTLGGEDNIVPVLSCFRVHDCVVFVMPYLPHDKFSSYVGDLSARELQTYLKGLLVALQRVHSHGIIHRDVKPSNFLYHRKTQRFLLVDFGLAQKVEECTGENGENLKESSSSPRLHDRKRKRDSLQENEVGRKRQALGVLSGNVASLSGGESRLKPWWSGDTTSKSSPTFPTKDLKSPSQLSSLKLQPLSQTISPSHPIRSFFKIHNSQVRMVGSVFAKPLPVADTKRCHCDGRARFCNLCLTRRARAAPRAGTPGFRPPEVLLKYPAQTTAVDMWAVGVMMLSIMSSTYPFFRSPDDITALAELITVFGTQAMKELAKKLGRNIVCSEKSEGLDLRKLCLGLRARQDPSPLLPTVLCSSCQTSPTAETQCCQCTDPRFPPQAYHLLSRLLDIDPESRITAEKALQHPFFSLQL